MILSALTSLWAVNVQDLTFLKLFGSALAGEIISMFIEFMVTDLIYLAAS